MRKLVVIAHDMRSTHNVGSLFRTCEGLGVHKLYLCGITPYPLRRPDDRLPHLAEKLDKQIDKTALGAARLLDWEHAAELTAVLAGLREEGYEIAALEQSAQAIQLPQYKAPAKVAVLLGPEVSGLPPEVLALADRTLEIPMFGKKESFNVVQAAAMCLYQLRFR